MIFELTFRACEDRFVLSKAFVRVRIHPDSPAVISTFAIGASTLAFVAHRGFACVDAAIELGDIVDSSLMVVLSFRACEDHFVLSRTFVRVRIHPDSPAVKPTFAVGASTLAFVTHLWRCCAGAGWVGFVVFVVFAVVDA